MYSRRAARSGNYALRLMKNGVRNIGEARQLLDGLAAFDGGSDLLWKLTEEGAKGLQTLKNAISFDRSDTFLTSSILPVRENATL